MTRTRTVGYLIADFTVEPLADFLTHDVVPPSVNADVAPFGKVTQELLALQQGQSAQRDFAVVWTRPEAIIPSFGKMLEYESVALEHILSEVYEFADLLIRAAAHVKYLFVPSWTLPFYRRGLGPLSMKPGSGWAYTLAQMNVRLAERIQQERNIFQLDAARWMAAAGQKGNSPKLWWLGKLPFGLEVFAEASADIKATLCGLVGLSKKLIVVDLDNTLWSGIVGEVGWEALRLGGHDPEGEALVAFQRGLKALTRTGTLLGIVSKNDEAMALSAIDNHPEMALRRSDFAAWRINWKDKAENMIDLVEELNLGLDAVVFIDDEPAERARVTEALPDVTVPDWPADKLLYPAALMELRWFDRATITEEDIARTQTYVSERERASQRQTFRSMEQWLQSLGMMVQVEMLEPRNLPRAAQLLNKTNQMNLTTRRLTESDLSAWVQIPGRQIYVFRVRDRFGEYGITALAGLQNVGTSAEITDFLLSCRVMGRGVEQAMLHLLVEDARAYGATQLVASYRPTPRNRPVLEFFRDTSGFQSHGDGVFTWNPEVPYAMPAHIVLERSPL